MVPKSFLKHGITYSTKLIFYFILILLLHDASAQNKKKSKKAYFIQITHQDHTISKGIFYNMIDNAIRIAIVKHHDTTFQDIPVGEMSKFFVRKKGTIAASVMIGMLTGALIGFATYSDPCGSEDGLCFDFGPGPPMGLGAVVGGLVGTGVGLALIKTFKIEGDIEKITQLKHTFVEYCLKCN